MQKITIKKHHSNEYLLTEDKLWVRDFTNKEAPYYDINELIRPNEYLSLVGNEVDNARRKYPEIGGEHILKPNVVIVSDGYKFEQKQRLLAALPRDICVIGTNKALSEWNMVGKSDVKRPMDFYVINNPYPEAQIFFPKKTNYQPRCIASVKTNPGFLKNYRGNVSSYASVPDKNYYGPTKHVEYLIDDYRNPICAAIGLSFRFGVQKLLMLCCDDSFDKDRPGADRLDNGLWCYPQQKISDRLVDANLYWLKKIGVDIGNHSSGLNLYNAEYISSEGIAKFFGG